MISRLNSARAFLTTFVLVIFFLAGCGDKHPETDFSQLPLERLPVREYPKFRDSRNFKDLEASIRQSLVYFNRVPATRTFVYGKDRYDAAHMIRSLETFVSFLANRPAPSELNQFIRDHFHVYKSVGNSEGQVLVTGYFEPSYRGSRGKSPEFPYPLYSLPRDLFRIDLSKFSDEYKGHKRLMARVDHDAGQILPYYARREINALPDFSDRAQPLVWLASRVDRFFLEIQGSGRVVLEDGEQMHIHYAGTNGNAYRSVGRYLIENDEIPREKMSMQAIREWLEENPHRMDEVLHFNDSFVFFKVGQGGPFGNIGVTVTPLRSIATDRKIFPRGGLAFVETDLPFVVNQPKESWDRAGLFVLNQDTGGAITGPGRVDLFCGNGKWASHAAGHMTAYGQLYFLVLKP